MSNTRIFLNSVERLNSPVHFVHPVESYTAQITLSFDVHI